MDVTKLIKGNIKDEDMDTLQSKFKINCIFFTELGYTVTGPLGKLFIYLPSMPIPIQDNIFGLCMHHKRAHNVSTIVVVLTHE